MRGYRPSHFAEADASQTDLLQEDRAKRIPHYAQRVAKGEPLFQDSGAIAVAQSDPPQPVAVPVRRPLARWAHHRRQPRPFR